MGKAATLVMFQPSALCERAHSVDTRTVAALDAITAFTVPNPSFSSQSQPVFSGLVAPSGHPDGQITQPTSDWQVLFRQSFQPSTPTKLNSREHAVNAKLAVKQNICEWKCGKGGWISLIYPAELVSTSPTGRAALQRSCFVPQQT